MKTNKSRTNLIVSVFAVLVLLITVGIFLNSSRDLEQSKSASDLIVELVKPIAPDLNDGDEWVLEVFVRKSAHVIEFGVLGAAVMCLMLSLCKRYREKLFGFSCFYVLAVGVIDEFIQSFSDRFSSASDILIDFAGAVLGFAVVWLIVYIAARVRRRRTVGQSKQN